MGCNNCEAFKSLYSLYYACHKCLKGIQYVKNGEMVKNGEQTYCRNQHLDKVSKTVLGQNVENIFSKWWYGNAEFDQTV